MTEAVLTFGDGALGGLGRSEAETSSKDALSSLKVVTDLSACLLPLLDALGWRGDSRHIAEALPHFVDRLDITDLRNVMGNLQYQSRPIRERLDRLNSRLAPFLFLPDGRDAIVVLEYANGMIRTFDGGRGETIEIPPRDWMGTAYFFSHIEEQDLRPSQKKAGWFATITRRFNSLVMQTFAMTLVLNLLAVATPLFVMAVYDTVVATESLSTLAYFAIGVGIAISCDMILRGIRSRILAFIGARLDNIVGNSLFEKILSLPSLFTERSTIGAQVARIKEIESVREFFTGPTVLVFFELPFVFVFLAVIAVLGGPLIIVPLAMIVLYLLLGVFMATVVGRVVSTATRAGSRRQEFSIEMLGAMRAIKYHGAMETWLQRYRDLSATSAMANFKAAQLSALIHTISQVFMTASGVATVTYGVFRIYDGEMTVGALIACMILTWRVLGPLQLAFITLPRLIQVRSSVRQINNLMNIPGERPPEKIITPMKHINGRLTFDHISMRYSPETEPALVGMNLEVNPGEVVGLVGPNGCGKSTVLKLVSGIYAAQAGRILIDNTDVRQLDPIELRHAISYVPQSCQFFYGTIAQNLRLAHPVATDADLRRATMQAAVLDDIMALPEGFDTRFGDLQVGQLPSGFQQQLNLARGFLKRSPILLLDEPGNGLSFEADQALMRTIESLKGRTTILFVTHRPSHLRLIDKLVWLDRGYIRAVGPVDEVRAIMPAGLI